MLKEEDNAMQGVEKETYRHATIQRAMNQYRSELHQIVDRLEALVGYMEICYESKEDTTPFGPETLFQLKWCREYHLEKSHNAVEEVNEIYRDYSVCINVLIRAFTEAFRISDPDGYKDMLYNQTNVFEYVFDKLPPDTFEICFIDDSYYGIMEHMYYKTINVRDELDFRVVRTVV